MHSLHVPLGSGNSDTRLSWLRGIKRLQGIFRITSRSDGPVRSKMLMALSRIHGGWDVNGTLQLRCTALDAETIPFRPFAGILSTIMLLSCQISMPFAQSSPHIHLAVNIHHLVP